VIKPFVGVANARNLDQHCPIGVIWSKACIVWRAAGRPQIAQWRRHDLTVDLHLQAVRHK